MIPYDGGIIWLTHQTEWEEALTTLKFRGHGVGGGGMHFGHSWSEGAGGGGGENMVAFWGLVWIFSRITHYFQENLFPKNNCLCWQMCWNLLHLASMEVCISSLLSVATALSKYQLWHDCFCTKSRIKLLRM